MPHVTVNGVSLHYVRSAANGGRSAADAPRGTDARAASAPVLVLLNGVFMNVERWAPLLPHLDGFDVLRYDMRGQGASDAPKGPYTPEVHARDLAGLLEGLGVSHYSLVGLSNGGIVAQAHALARPKGLERLVLVATTPHLDVSLTSKFRAWLRAVELGGVAHRIEVSMAYAFGRTFLAAHPEVIAPEAIAQAAAAAPTAEAQRELLLGLLAMPDFRPMLPRIVAKTLVVSGEEDLLFPPPYGAAIAQSIPDAHFAVAPAVGHQPPLEDPATFARLLRAFLTAP
jgi:3-oxoadipate enol-lactonase